MNFKSIFIFICCFSILIASKAEAKEYILFSKLTDEGFWQIWMMQPNGDNAQQITTSPEDKREPFWVDHLNKVGYRTANGELFLVDLDGRDTKEILAEFKPMSSPNYAGGTRELVFVRFQPGKADIGDIWKHNFDTGQTQVLSRSRLLSFQPLISTDGQRVVYIQKDDEQFNQIWMMNGDGAQPAKLTQLKGRLASPQLSSDKKSVLFTSNYSNDDFDLYQIDVLTKDIKPIVQHQGRDRSPTYALDNTRAAFVSNRSGIEQIWMVDLNDGTQKQITSGAPSVDPLWVNIEEEVAK